MEGILALVVAGVLVGLELEEVTSEGPYVLVEKGKQLAEVVVMEFEELHRQEEIHMAKKVVHMLAPVGIWMVAREVG